MKIYELFFSPTGGTKKAADILAHSLVDEIVTIDLTDSNTDFHNVSLSEEDVALIAVPSYAGRVPAPAASRLAAVNGGGARAVLICVYGNRAYEDTLAEMEDIATQSGFRIISAVAAIAEHSIARQFAAGRPDADDQKVLSEFASQIRKKIADGNPEKPDIPGNRPYKKGGAIPMIPRPTEKCVKCGLCAKECPVQAIDAKNPDIVQENTCISCMRCVSVCPHDARKIDDMMMNTINEMLKKVCTQRKECELYL